jgi:hypothetical protein
MAENENSKVCAHLFSGGSDSCLAALKLAEEYDRVELVTMTRRGFSSLDNVEAQVRRLERYFGRDDIFRLHFVPHDNLFRFVLYDRYFRNLGKYGSMMLSHCGLCKVAIHWRALVWCLDNGIKRVSDGAVRASEEYPAQNERIMLGRLREVYASLGVDYLNPVYEEPSTESALYNLRFTRKLNFKKTDEDRQIFCDQQVLYAMFMRHFRPKYSQEEFEKRMAVLYTEKLDQMEQMTREYVEQGKSSRLAGLLEE